MAEYSKIFTNPYPSGWENLPSLKTPIIAQALQQHTNTIINIENYLSDNEIPTRISELINDILIPTRTSQLENDSGFITKEDIPSGPSKTSQLENDSGFLTKEEIEMPEKLSEFVNDSGFITNLVNDLVNYYTKAELYNKSQIEQLIANNKFLSIKVVDELPTENISDSTIYFVPKSLDNIVLVNDYNLNIENDVVNNAASELSLGERIDTEETLVEDPFNG